MDVYIDLLLIENFIVNTFLLVILNQILRQKIIYKKIILAGGLGAIYTLVMVVPELYVFSTLPFKILVTVLIVYISNNNKNIYFLFKESIIFTLLSIFLSGFCLLFAIYQNGFVIGEGFAINNLSFKFIILSLMIIYIILFRFITNIKDKVIISKLIYDLLIIHNGKRYAVKAFLDTGNELVEPATCLPVILVEKKYLENIIFSEENKYKIPYQVIEGNGGFLYGFIPDEIHLKNEKHCDFSKKAIICLCNNKLSKANEFGALLSRGVL